MTRSAPFLLALLGGCSAGQVTMPEELGQFGRGRSAVWLVVTNVDEGDVEIDHLLLISNESGLCNTLQTVYPEIAAATAAYESAYEDIDYDSPDYYEQICNMYKTILTSFGEATKPLIHDGAHLLTLSTSTREGDEWSSEPTAGGYEDCYADYYSEETCDRRYGGTLGLFTANPYEVGADAMSCEGANSSYDFYYDFYPALSAQEPIDLDGGTLTLTAGGATSIGGVLTGADLGDATGLEAKATFERCDVQVNGEVYLPGF